jgi:hypothetical protein
MKIDDSLHLCLEQLLQATETRLHGAVNRRTTNGDTKPRRTKQRVLLGVNANTEVVAGSRRKAPTGISTAQAPALETVLHSLRNAVVARGYDPVL